MFLMKQLLSVMFVLLLSQVFGQKKPEELVKNDWPNTVSAFGKNSKNVPSHYIFVVIVLFKMAYNVLQLQEVGDFDHKVDVENQTLITHKCVFGALNRQFLVGVVMCCPSFIL